MTKQTTVDNLWKVIHKLSTYPQNPQLSTVIHKLSTIFPQTFPQIIHIKHFTDCFLFFNIFHQLLNCSIKFLVGSNSFFNFITGM